MENKIKSKSSLNKERFIFQIGNYSRIRKLSGLKNLSDGEINLLLANVEDF